MTKLQDDDWLREVQVFHLYTTVQELVLKKKQNSGKLFAYKLYKALGEQKWAKNINENTGETTKYWIKVWQDCFLTKEL